MNDRTCAHPGCTGGLTQNSPSGVCSAHLHQLACRCGPCLSRRARRPQPVPRPLASRAIRTVHISHVTAFSAGIARFPVSLPCEPWETPDA